jgi:guanylate kinase
VRTKGPICSKNLPKRKLPESGKLVVLSGPSGVGKGTLVGNILKRVPNVFYSISATTRHPRADERDRVNYFFYSREQFEEGIREGTFLEWAKVYDDYYGTPLRPIISALQEGKIVILEIDVQGAVQVKEQVGAAAFYVFIAPPSLAELKRRLGIRNSESNEEQLHRLDTAVRELEYKDKYDHVIVNDDLEAATDELTRILLALDGGG